MTRTDLLIILLTGMAGATAWMVNNLLYRLLKPRLSAVGFFFYILLLLLAVLVIILLFGIVVMRFRLFLFQ